MYGCVFIHGEVLTSVCWKLGWNPCAELLISSLVITFQGESERREVVGARPALSMSFGDPPQPCAPVLCAQQHMLLCTQQRVLLCAQQGRTRLGGGKNNMFHTIFTFFVTFGHFYLLFIIFAQLMTSASVAPKTPPFRLALKSYHQR